MHDPQELRPVVTPLVQDGVELRVGEAPPAVEEPVVHLPEPLVSTEDAGGLGGPGRPAGVGVLVVANVRVAIRAEREVFGRHRHVGTSGDEPPQLGLDLSAVGALVVGDDHDTNGRLGRTDQVTPGEGLASGGGVDDLLRRGVKLLSGHVLGVGAPADLQHGHNGERGEAPTHQPACAGRFTFGGVAGEGFRDHKKEEAAHVRGDAIEAYVAADDHHDQEHRRHRHAGPDDIVECGRNGSPRTAGGDRPGDCKRHEIREAHE